MIKEPDRFQSVIDEPVILPEGTDTNNSSKKHKSKPKSKSESKVAAWIWWAMGVVTVAAIAVSVYFLIIKPTSNQSTPKTQPTSPENTDNIVVEPEGEESPVVLGDEEYLKLYDEQLATLEGDEHLLVTLEKISKLTSLKRYDEAIATLSTIKSDGLSDERQYNLYATCIYLYKELGNEAEVERYTALSDAAYQRLEAAGYFKDAPAEPELPEDPELSNNADSTEESGSPEETEPTE